MLKAAPPNAVSFSGTLWFPGAKPEGFAVTPLSERALAIDKAREELLGLLHDLPESDHELSLTDLVEKGLPANAEPAPSETTVTVSSEGDLNRISEGRDRRNWKKSRSSRSSSREGVLLNMYMPMSLTRSLTGSRSSRKSADGDCNKRDRESTTTGCWTAIWERARRKWRKKI